MSSLSPVRDRIVPRLTPLRLVASSLLFLSWATLSIGQTQGREVLCRSGDGNFDAESRTGIKLHVGAVRNGELATRACAAKLSWGKQEVVVATGVAQLDLDAFGADLGNGVPVAAFQIRESDTDCCMEYRIYSLDKPSRLLRTLTGGDFFSASDMDLDGRVEIWTHDAAAANGFENLALSELDSAPTVVFCFIQGQLMDVSAEFQSNFDEEIARVRGGIRSRDLEDFKSSDGKLTAVATPSTADELHRVRNAKIKVLEIVWAYLYSGRDQEAWRSLAEMWPAQDIGRIRAAIVNLRTRGIHSQADGASGAPRGKKKHAQIFDAVDRTGPPRKLEVIPPRAILLRYPPASEIRPQGPSKSELLLDLIVDAGGKVRSAEPAGKLRWFDPDLINAALTWKFIPAFKDGRAVASRLRIAVSPKQ